MKAAKDGQGAANCIEMYPKCTNDTDSVSNLPMVIESRSGTHNNSNKNNANNFPKSKPI